MLAGARWRWAAAGLVDMSIGWLVGRWQVGGDPKNRYGRGEGKQCLQICVLGEMAGAGWGLAEGGPAEGQ